MKILRKNTKNSRKAFTLLEMVLVIAIMMIVFVYIVSTFTIVNKSHLKVTRLDAMHDYASLNLNAISNSLCNATNVSGGSKITCDGQYVLLNGGKILPSFDVMFAWSTSIKFTTYPDSRTVKVEITLYDASADTTYCDETIVYCPACENMDEVTGAGSIGYSYDVVDS